jgi:hypothetical protein
MKLQLNAITELLTSMREVENMHNGVGSMRTELLTPLKSNMFNKQAKENAGTVPNTPFSHEELPKTPSAHQAVSNSPPKHEGVPNSDLERKRMFDIPPELLGGALYDFSPDNIPYEEYMFQKKEQANIRRKITREFRKEYKEPTRKQPVRKVRG